MNKRQRNKWYSTNGEVPRYRYRIDLIRDPNTRKQEFKGLYRQRFDQALKGAGLSDDAIYAHLHYWDHYYLMELINFLDDRNILMMEYSKLDETYDMNAYQQAKDRFDRLLIEWFQDNDQLVPVVVRYLDWLRHCFATSKITYEDLEISCQIKWLMIALSEHDWKNLPNAVKRWPNWWN